MICVFAGSRYYAAKCLQLHGSDEGKMLSFRIETCQLRSIMETNNVAYCCHGMFCVLALIPHEEALWRRIVRGGTYKIPATFLLSLFD